MQQYPENDLQHEIAVSKDEVKSLRKRLQNQIQNNQALQQHIVDLNKKIEE